MADATEFRKAGTVVTIAVVMAALFATAYTVALGRPLPHDLPIGVVGPGAPAALAQLGEQQQGFTLYPYPTRQAAEAAVDQQRITAILDATGDPQLLISSASDPSAARVLTQLVHSAPTPLPIADLHPLPPTDPAGLATFYLVIAATILGFITMFQLRANVKTLTVRRWIGWVVVLAVLGGLALAVVTGPVLHAVEARFGELWLLTSAQIGVAALFNSTMLVLVGRWAIIPTWIMFILLGNTSSGGAVSASLLPQPFAFLNHALPSGATVSALHTASYFPDNQRLLPFVVLGLWLAGSLGALIIASRVSGRTPAD